MLDLIKKLSAASYKETLKILKEQNVDERPPLDPLSSIKLIDILLQVQPFERVR